MDKAPIIYLFPGLSGGLGKTQFMKQLPAGYADKFKHESEHRDGPGPGNQNGLFVSRFQGHDIAYDTENYNWKQVGDCWIGVLKNYTPDMFAKASDSGRHPAAGYPVELGDGNQYVIPVALADAPNFDIPWRETLDGEGNITRETDDYYAAVCAAADKIYEAIINGQDGVFTMDEDELRDALANAIAVNYKLDKQECLVLGLFTSETYMAIAGAIVDLPGIRELAKKKAPNEQDTNSGETDD